MTGKSVSERRWQHVASAIATGRGVDPREVLTKGCRNPRVIEARREAFRSLLDNGYSASAIARASGFQESTVRLSRDIHREQVAQGAEA